MDGNTHSVQLYHIRSAPTCFPGEIAKELVARFLLQLAATQ